MINSADLIEGSERSRKMQKAIRESTFAPEVSKTLRKFSSWEASELILKVNPRTLANKSREEADMPSGEIEAGKAGMRWFSLDELNQIRRAWREHKKATLTPIRPEGKRAVRVAVANFKGGAGKSTVALHFAHAAALDGYRVLVVDFDPQATISHAMGLVNVDEEGTVWGIIARDLVRETERMNLLREASGLESRKLDLPSSIVGSQVGSYRLSDFIERTCWSTIDIIPSCANAAFVEFASGEYRQRNPTWTFFAAMDRYLNALRPGAYDMVIFDCPPAIGYQSLNAVFAADVLYVPTGPGYWEYDSTTSFMAQLGDALTEISAGFRDRAEMAGRLPKEFGALRVLMTRFEPSNELHLAMRGALGRVFPDWMTEHPIEMTRAVEQTGRFLQSVYEMDYRNMTRETWKRARASFDSAYTEFRTVVLDAWSKIPDAADQGATGTKEAGE